MLTFVIIIFIIRLGLTSMGRRAQGVKMTKDKEDPYFWVFSEGWCF